MMAAPPLSDLREIALRDWLGSLKLGFSIATETLSPASADASFRRYFRVHTDQPARPTLIVMDAPPEREPCAPFVKVAARFAHAQVSVPEVLAADLEQGYLLLTDLGVDTYLSVLNVTNASGLYADAVTALLRIQLLPACDFLAAYDRPLLERELQLFPEWYLGRQLGYLTSETERAALQKVFDDLLANALAQPQVAVHRDYHARNLMVLPAHQACGNPGILDFQDAVVGPITYDLVSLFRDAYISWEEEEILDWTVRYWEAARRAHLPVNPDFGEFWRDFEWMGLQRHLKVLGIFSRLSHRDGKPAYLQNLPLVLQYTRAVASRYRNFFPLMRILDSAAALPSRTGYTF